jgi:hypothetical protein
VTTHEEIVLAFQNYLKESENFEGNDVKAAAGRARKALMDLNKLSKTRRAEIQERKNSM